MLLLISFNVKMIVTSCTFSFFSSKRTETFYPNLTSISLCQLNSVPGKQFYRSGVCYFNFFTVVCCPILVQLFEQAKTCSLAHEQNRINLNQETRWSHPFSWHTVLLCVITLKSSALKSGRRIAFDPTTYYFICHHDNFFTISRHCHISSKKVAFCLARVGLQLQTSFVADWHFWQSTWNAGWKIAL